MCASSIVHRGDPTDDDDAGAAVDHDCRDDNVGGEQEAAE